MKKMMIILMMKMMLLVTMVRALPAFSAEQEKAACGYWGCMRNQGQRTAFSGEGQRATFSGEGQRATFSAEQERAACGYWGCMRNQGQRAAFSGEGQMAAFSGEGQRATFSAEQERAACGYWGCMRNQGQKAAFSGEGQRAAFIGEGQRAAGRTVDAGPTMSSTTGVEVIPSSSPTASSHDWATSFVDYLKDMYTSHLSIRNLQNIYNMLYRYEHPMFHPVSGKPPLFDEVLEHMKEDGHINVGENKVVTVI